MKKNRSFCLFSVILLMVCICSCSVNNINKINDYETKIYNIANQYGLIITKDITESSIDYEFLSGDKRLIALYLSNEQNDEKDANFFISYRNNFKDELDLGLFVQIVNALSLRPLSSDFCKKLIDEYDKDQVYQERADTIFSTQHSLDFWENYILSYTVYIDKTQELQFNGKTYSYIQP